MYRVTHKTKRPIKPLSEDESIFQFNVYSSVFDRF